MKQRPGIPPLPWQHSVSHTYGLIDVRDANGRLIAYVFGNKSALTPALTLPERDAVVRLLMSAPQMLQALIVAEEFMSGFEGDDQVQAGITERLQQVRRAIDAASPLFAEIPSELRVPLFAVEVSTPPVPAPIRQEPGEAEYLAVIGDGTEEAP